jgi:hypothetical protein
MEQLFVQHPWIIAIILIWTLPWKAAALWRSARRGHFGWFFALLIINSLAILDILYIFIFSRPKAKKPEEIVAETSSEKPSTNPTVAKIMVV